MKTAIYIRVSSEGQALKGHSLEAQEKAGINVCKQNHWSYEVFREAGKSADKDNLDNRPELQKILNLADDGEINNCFVTELDRISRSPATLEYIKKIFRDNDVKVVTQSSIYDFKDEENEFMVDLLGLLAKRENRVRVKRSKRAIEEGMLKGFWCQGGDTIPYGYMKKDRKLVVNPKEVKIYKMMVEWSLSGKGLITIAKRLNDMGIKTKKSNDKRVFKWKGNVVRSILKHTIYKGEYTFKSHKLKMPAIITVEKWQAIQDNLKKNYRCAKRNTKRFYLLRGLLYCKRCGHRLFGKIKPSSGERNYCCLSKRTEYTNCGLRSINLDKIDRLIWEKTREILLNSEKLKEVIASQDNELFVDIAEIEVQTKHLEKAITDRDEEIKDLIRRRKKYKNISDREIDQIILDIKQEKEALINQKQDLIQKIENTKSAKEQSKQIADYIATLSHNIDSLPDQDRFDLLHLLIHKIIIDYDVEAKEHTAETIYKIPVEEPTPNRLLQPSHIRSSMMGRAKRPRGDETLIIP